MVVPNNHGVFLLKMIIMGCEMGVPPFQETPISCQKKNNGLFRTALLNLWSDLDLDLGTHNPQTHRIPMGLLYQYLPLH